jgi:methylthioribose-1-phosphate isomerase
LAKHFCIPFYVAAPQSTLDAGTATGKNIIIEERPTEEVSALPFKSLITHPEAKIRNPAFDVTDRSLVTAIITDKGLF